MFATQGELEFGGADDAAPAVVGAQVIAQMIEGGTSVAEISRRIALEISLLLIELTPDRRPRLSGKQISEHVKLYRELQRTLAQSDKSRNDDSLDIDGTKFRYVFREIQGLFQQALRDTGLEPGLVHNAMLQFRDLVSTHEEVMRAELRRMDREGL